MIKMERTVNTDVFKKILANKLGIKPSQVKHILIPQKGEVIVCAGLLWQVSYCRENPFRITMDLIRIARPEDYARYSPDLENMYQQKLHPILRRVNQWLIKLSTKSLTKSSAKP